MANLKVMDVLLYLYFHVFELNRLIKLVDYFENDSTIPA